MFAFGRKAMTYLESILKTSSSQPTKVHLVKAMVFPVVMYGYDSWTIKKAECWRIEAFEVWCWRKLLRVPWTARSNKSILKEISPEYSLEGTDAEAESRILWSCDANNWLLEKDLDAGKDWRQEKGETEDQMVRQHHWLNGCNFTRLWEIVKDRETWCEQSMRSQRVWHDLVTEPQQHESWGILVKPEIPQFWQLFHQPDIPQFSELEVPPRSMPQIIRL